MRDGNLLITPPPSRSVPVLAEALAVHHAAPEPHVHKAVLDCLRAYERACAGGDATAYALAAARPTAAIRP